MADGCLLFKTAALQEPSNWGCSLSWGTSAEAGNRDLAGTMAVLPAPSHSLSFRGLGWLTFFLQGWNSVSHPLAILGQQVSVEQEERCGKIVRMTSSVHAKSFQLCLTLYNPSDCTPPGFSVHGVFQARILEWVAISFSRHLPDPGTKSASLMSPTLPGSSLSLAPSLKSKNDLWCG